MGGEGGRGEGEKRWKNREAGRSTGEYSWEGESYKMEMVVKSKETAWSRGE